MAVRRLAALLIERQGLAAHGLSLGPAGRLLDKVAAAYCHAQAYELQTWWKATAIRQGKGVGPEASTTKVYWSELDVAIHETALEILGPEAELLGADGELGDWLDGFLFALAGPIYAGTNQIQRNVVAERLLGLPRS